MGEESVAGAGAGPEGEKGSPTESGERFHFKFKVLGRYDSRLRGNEPHVTLNLLAGRKDHLVFCGTLTLSEPEWSALRERLKVALGDALEVEDMSPAGGNPTVQPR